ncbi:CPCC family cysteine-rich protein, partial [Gracilimonas sp.]
MSSNSSTSKVKSTCPCCHYVTLKERNIYEICPVCYWEDEG